MTTWQRVLEAKADLGQTTGVFHHRARGPRDAVCSEPKRPKRGQVEIMVSMKIKDMMVCLSMYQTGAQHSTKVYRSLYFSR